MSKETKKKLTPKQVKKKKQELGDAWRHEHTKIINFRCNIDEDADILQKIKSVPNKASYLKSLIRADIIKSVAE